MVVLLIVETWSQCAWAQDAPAKKPDPAVAQEVDADEQAAAGAEAEAKAKAEADAQAAKQEAVVQECQRLVLVAIGRVVAPEIFPEILSKGEPGNTVVRVSIDQRQLVVEVAGSRALSCAIACGRIGRETQTGRFAVESKSDRSPAESRYGSLIDAKGHLLLKGIYGNLDPVPAGATFVPSPPNVYIVLSEGVVIHSGDANGTASTDGAIVIPSAAARTLLKILEKGMPVEIE
ncbi:MAG: L,D-transpeptidase [Verrucomicrobia bacterium]|nr:L,D-transpeptidase [Verrucomicrobiota bacterium]